jgi:uncharacterized RDD family membrane protein YckC
MGNPLAAPGGEGLEDHYAGIVSRFVGFFVDITAIAVLFSLAGTVLEYVLTILLRHPVHLGDSKLASNIALGVWALVYFAYPLSVSGRTLGMALVGLRAVRADGARLPASRAVVRTLFLPLSLLLFGLGFALIALRRDRRALHDLIGGSAVVYAWDARAARIRFLARR